MPGPLFLQNEVSPYFQEGKKLNLMEKIDLFKSISSNSGSSSPSPQNKRGQDISSTIGSSRSGSPNEVLPIERKNKNIRISVMATPSRKILKKMNASPIPNDRPNKTIDRVGFSEKRQANSCSPPHRMMPVDQNERNKTQRKFVSFNRDTQSRNSSYRRDRSSNQNQREKMPKKRVEIEPKWMKTLGEKFSWDPKQIESLTHKEYTTTKKEDRKDGNKYDTIIHSRQSSQLVLPQM